MLYSILSYFILGLLFAVYYMRIEDTDTGPFSCNAAIYNSKSGFDKDWVPLFSILWLISPLVLPIVLMIWLIHYTGTKIYTKWFKPLD